MLKDITQGGAALTKTAAHANLAASVSDVEISEGLNLSSARVVFNIT